MQLIIGEAGGNVAVSLDYPGAKIPTAFGAPSPFISPLGPKDLDALRFYLEEYLSLPTGEYATLGEAVASTKLREWGEALFAAVFGPVGDPRHQAYANVVATLNDKKPVEVTVQSGNARFLSLPWELLRAPGAVKPLALLDGVIAFDRGLPTTSPARVFSNASDGIRVLMVIARPEGERDVGYQTIARPLFELVRSTGDKVAIDVLRPPTFEAFKAALNEAKEQGKPYHVVHFDGHGVFAKQSGVSGASFDPRVFYKDPTAGPIGMLAFETATGTGSGLVSADDFAAALAAGDVPLVVLNACQSATINSVDDMTAPEATVATRLLQLGAASVVAMTHSVYVVAAAAFMTTFYQQLFKGRSVSQAVSDGRRALTSGDNRLRPALKGLMPLEDWMVPVHYAWATLRLPGLETTAAKSSDDVSAIFGQMLTGRGASTSADRTNDPLAADSHFEGRDAEFHTLERIIRTKRVGVIQGVGGTGKTELAKAFARWLQVSDGIAHPSLVFFSSFEPGVATFGLESVLGTILAHPVVQQVLTKNGRADQLREARTLQERQHLALLFLGAVPSLLVWDNFESVVSLPEPGQATPPLGQDKLDELRAFAQAIGKTKSVLLITSRSAETWLGGPDLIARVEVRGLREPDALRYADILLASSPAAIKRRENDAAGFKSLLEYLGGHPLSLRLILPHLETQTPTALLQGLKGQGELPPGFQEGAGRLKSLGESVYYSLQHLSDADRALLPVLSLFEQVVSVSVLAVLSKLDEAPPSVKGVDIKVWHRLLDTCAHLGLVSGMGGGLYRLHPALPGYLAAEWRATAGATHAADCEALLRALVIAFKYYGAFLNGEIQSGNAQLAFGLLRAQRPMLGAMIEAALAHDLYSEAQQILQPLDELWDVAGLTEEARAWSDRIVMQLEGSTGEVPDMATPAGELWLFISGSEANRAHRAGRLDQVEQIYQSLAAHLERQNTDAARRLLATAYHQIGMVAQHRGDHTAAEGWYRKSLQIEEQFDNRQGMASSYHQLGIVAQHRGDLTAAEGWYRKSLEVKEQLGNRPGMASSYHQIGTVALDRGDLAAAEGWYRKSLEIFEQLGDQPHMASSYHQIGMSAQLRGDLAAAEGWYRKSLEVKEQLGNRQGMASSYHQIGRLAQDRGDLAAAEGWYLKSLEIKEQLGNRPSMASSYHQLGMVAGNRGDLTAAEGWHRKSLEIEEQFGNRPGMATSYGQLGRSAQLRGDLDAAAGWLRKSLEVREQLGDRLGMAKSLASFGHLETKRGNTTAALDFAIRAGTVTGEFPNRHSSAPRDLAEFYSALGHDTVATAWHRITGKPMTDDVRQFLVALSEALKTQSAKDGAAASGGVSSASDTSVVTEAGSSSAAPSSLPKPFPPASHAAEQNQQSGIQTNALVERTRAAAAERPPLAAKLTEATPAAVTAARQSDIRWGRVLLAVLAIVIITSAAITWDSIVRLLP